MKKELWFDMDGTFVDLYGVEGWLSDLINKKVRPYAVAKPLINLSLFARYLNKLQRKGYTLNIISWCSKNSTEEYDIAVINTKKNWLKKHLPSVNWDRIEIVPYGTYKEKVADYTDGILFDDEENNRNYWTGKAYNVENIIGVLKAVVTA